ncbi:MAG: hypothetical protein QOJ52_2527 [Acidimicrobiaceae bacterium]|jgi:hypothetical protein|nr:hypothetical protein [Acidimicrobiaceae bacterium]
MGGTAVPSAAGNGGRTRDQKQPGGADANVARDLHDAWQLAFVVVADGDLATKAVTKAFIDATPTDAVSPPSRLELLAAAFRIALTRAADSPDRESDSAVTTALWQLPAQQRGALWLAKVNELDTPALAAVLGLTTPNADQVASRAAEWLDVALDHDTGPLCSEELKLADFIAGHLAADEEASMRAHLPDCQTCQTKERAFEELADLKTVLVAAVPEPPAWLTIETLEHQERTAPTNGTATLVDTNRRTPAFRPLAACCAVLLIVGLIGLFLIRPTKASTDPVGSSDQRAIVPQLSDTSANGALVGSSVDLPASATTIVVTTTSVPAVTFPTIPAGGTKKGKP